MKEARSDHIRLSRLLHEHFDDIEPSNSLRSCLGIFHSEPSRMGTTPSTIAAASATDGVDGGTPKSSGRRPRIWFTTAAVVIVTAGALITVSAGRHSQEQEPPVGSPTPHTLPADLASMCDSPTSKFARFWILSSGGDQSERYRGTIRIGSADIPALSIYASGAPLGTGIMCVSNEKLADAPPVRSAALPKTGALAYLAFDSHGILWGGVRASVTRISISSGSDETKYSTDGIGELQLQDLGQGWHAFSTGIGIAATESVTITARAFGAGGQVIDTQELAVGGSAKSSESEANTTAPTN